MTTATPADPKRRALGKGLDSLLPRVPAKPAETPAAPAPEAEGGKPREISVESIDRNPYQTRTVMNQEQLSELSASITANGVVQPILVRPLANGRFQLIAGERRWRASMLAGKKTIPAILRQVSDEQALEITIVENLQRADLNPMEQARAFERLGREFHMTQEQIATRTGKDRASVGNFLRLLKLPNSVQQMVESGTLTFGHARAILALPDPEMMEEAAQLVIDRGLSVRNTEAWISAKLNPVKVEKPGKPEIHEDPNVREVREQLQRALGLKVTIDDHKGRGKVIIEYSKLEDFDTLLESLSRR
ncbi:ParB/RepB/Spo0J family partition protein [Acidobacteria bacterium AB60]|nr:ParB/RepB/Spo0J family partition protein [Acidobacteria bacterium AB60]